MSFIPVARRYARALLDVAGPKADAVLEQLESLTAFFQGQPPLFSALSSPALSKPQRHALLDAVAKAVTGLDPLLLNTLKLLTDRGRFDALPAVTRGFRDMVDARLGRLRGVVTSPRPLARDQVAAIAASLKKLTARDVVLAEKLDPSLLGGVVAQVGSTVYDGSLKSQLKDLERTLR